MKGWYNIAGWSRNGDVKVAKNKAGRNEWWGINERGNVASNVSDNAIGGAGNGATLLNQIDVWVDFEELSRVQLEGGRRCGINVFCHCNDIDDIEECSIRIFQSKQGFCESLTDEQSRE